MKHIYMNFELKLNINFLIFHNFAYKKHILPTLLYYFTLFPNLILPIINIIIFRMALLLYIYPGWHNYFFFFSGW